MTFSLYVNNVSITQNELVLLLPQFILFNYQASVSHLYNLVSDFQHLLKYYPQI